MYEGSYVREDSYMLHTCSYCSRYSRCHNNHGNNHDNN